MRTRPAFPMILAVLLTLAAATGAVDAQEGAPQVESAPPDCADHPMAPFDPVCQHSATGLRIVTVDTVVRADQDDVKVEIPLGAIRYSGAVVQVFYNSAVGKAEWFMIPDLHGIVIFPDGVTLPVGRWIASGLPVGTVVRVVALIPAPG